MIKHQVSTLFMWAFLPVVAISQVSKKEIITVNLNTKSFDDVLPYDEPFIITGDVGKREGIEVVGLEYELKTKKKKSIIPIKFRSGKNLVEINPDGSSFAFPCEGIYPNREYRFTFSFYSSFSEAKKKNAIKTLIADSWKTFLEVTQNNYNDTDLLDLETNIDQAIKKQIACSFLYTLKHCANKTIQVEKIDLSSPIFSFNKVEGEMFNYMIEAAKPINEYKKRKNGFIQSLKNDFDDPRFADYILFLLDTSNLTKFSATSTNARIDSSDSRFKNLTIRNFSPYFLEILNKEYGNGREPLLKIFQLLNGEGEFRDKFIYPSTKHDLGFLSFLSKYFGDLTILNFKNQDCCIEQKKMIRRFRTDLNDYINLLNEYYLALEASENFANTLPDLTAKYFAANFVSFDEKVSVELANTSSPYISLDGGIGYNPGFKNFFSHFGVNFYLVPVKKRVPLNTYKESPWLYLLKSTSINVSIINNYFDEDKNGDRYVPLLESKRDLMLALGHRFNRAMKINVGSAFDFRKNEDPLVDKKRLQGKFVVSLSVDVDLISGFTNAGKALKIIQ